MKKLTGCKRPRDLPRVWTHVRQLTGASATSQTLVKSFYSPHYQPVIVVSSRRLFALLLYCNTGEGGGDTDSYFSLVAPLLETVICASVKSVITNPDCWVKEVCSPLHSLIWSSDPVWWRRSLLGSREKKTRDVTAAWVQDHHHNQTSHQEMWNVLGFFSPLNVIVQI